MVGGGDGLVYKLMTKCNRKTHWEDILIWGECHGSCGLKKSTRDIEKEVEAKRKVVEESIKKANEDAKNKNRG